MSATILLNTKILQKYYLTNRANSRLTYLYEISVNFLENRCCEIQTQSKFTSLERPVESAKQAVLSQRQQNAVSQRTIYNFHSSSVICENKEIKGKITA